MIYTLSKQGEQALKDEEGFRRIPYNCSSGKLTVGYGHRLYSPCKSITKEQAEQWFMEDTTRVLTVLWHDNAKLNQNKVDALCSFIYNIGINAWNHSTVRTFMVRNIMKVVALQMERWIHDDHGQIIPGLVMRRKREVELFQK